MESFINSPSASVAAFLSKPINVLTNNPNPFVVSFAFSTKPLSFSAKPKSIFSSSSMSVFVIGLLFLSLLIDILLS